MTKTLFSKQIERGLAACQRELIERRYQESGAGLEITTEKSA